MINKKDENLFKLYDKATEYSEENLDELMAVLDDIHKMYKAKKDALNEQEEYINEITAYYNFRYFITDLLPKFIKNYIYERGFLDNKFLTMDFIKFSTIIITDVEQNILEDDKLYFANGIVISELLVVSEDKNKLAIFNEYFCQFFENYNLGRIKRDIDNIQYFFTAPIKQIIEAYYSELQRIEYFSDDLISSIKEEENIQLDSKDIIRNLRKDK